LFENHPDLYQRATQYEKENLETGDRYTWSDGESLKELIQPDRIKKVKEEHTRRQLAISQRPKPMETLVRMFGKDFSDEGGDEGCLICHL
jgi:hypothetical protein